MSTTPATLTVRCSSLPRLALCSAPLGAGANEPQIDPLNDAATLGTVVHDVLATLVRTGELGDVERAALEHQLPEDMIEEARILAYTGAIYWRENAERFPNPMVERSIDTEGLTEGLSLTGQLDVHSFIDETAEVRILDFKSGRVERDHYHQVKGYALLACNYHLANKATATLINLRDKTTETYSWTADELVSWWSTVVLGQILRYKDRYSPGAHCEFCPIRHSCEGRKAIVRSAIADLTEMPVSGVDVMVAALNDIEQRRHAGVLAGDVYTKLGMIERAIDDFRTSLHANVKQLGPLDVGGGRVLKIIESNREKLDPVKSWPVVCEVLTEAEIAPAITLSKTKILDAVGAKVEKGKGKAKEAMMEQLKAAGAVTVTTSESLKIVKKES